MTKQPYSADFTLGILGGGQLGRMLQQEAANLDIRLAVLDPDPEAPCAKLVPRFVQGSFKDYQTVLDFGLTCDLITIEIEAVNIEALYELERRGVAVFPQPRVIEIIQDKGTQKQFFKDHDIPTAPFELCESLAEFRGRLELLPLAQKLRKGGYDGRGVSIIRTKTDLDKAFDAPSVLEQYVPFEKELSVIVARNDKGETAAFPVVELEFNPEANLVEMLFAPADISAEMETKAAEIAQRTIEALDMVGILAVEMFLTNSGEILVNEVAPRPHNSGHQTIEGNVTSQYAQHLRAILNLPLGDTAQIRPAAMINLLGEPGFEGAVYYEGLDTVLAKSGVYVHLYGKAETRPFRKMGHVTLTAPSIHDVQKMAVEIKNLIKVKSK